MKIECYDCRDMYDSKEISMLHLQAGKVVKVYGNFYFCEDCFKARKKKSKNKGSGKQPSVTETAKEIMKSMGLDSN